MCTFGTLNYFFIPGLYHAFLRQLICPGTFAVLRYQCSYDGPALCLVLMSSHLPPHCQVWVRNLLDLIVIKWSSEEVWCHCFKRNHVKIFKLIIFNIVNLMGKEGIYFYYFIFSHVLYFNIQFELNFRVIMYAKLKTWSRGCNFLNG